jgi:hypothetical protein
MQRPFRRISNLSYSSGLVFFIFLFTLAVKVYSPRNKNKESREYYASTWSPSLPASPSDLQTVFPLNMLQNPSVWI